MDFSLFVNPTDSKVVAISIYLIPNWDPDTPDYLAADGPVVHDFQPLEHLFFKFFRIEFYAIVFDCLNNRFFEFVNLDKPIGDGKRFKVVATFVTGDDAVNIMFVNFFNQFFGLEVVDDFFSGVFYFHSMNS